MVISRLTFFFQKIELLNELKQKNGYHYLIEVDGGINLDTAKKCKNAGVDCVVAGSYIFKNKDRNQVITDLKSI